MKLAIWGLYEFPFYEVKSNRYDVLLEYHISCARERNNSWRQTIPRSGSVLLSILTIKVPKNFTLGNQILGDFENWPALCSGKKS